MERALLDVSEAMAAHDFGSVCEANEYLQTLIGERPGRERSQKRQAQELAFQALETDGRNQKITLARQAIRLDPDCADAWNAFAQATATSPQDLIAKLRHAVAAGERSLGAQFFEECRGHFWHAVESRPYMRARYELASALVVAGSRKEAISHFEEMLELNPDDNQGVRDVLLGCYFSAGELERARELLDLYGEDMSAVFCWGRVLERLISGSESGARIAVEDALEQNRHVLEFLTGRRTIPRVQMDYYARGRESEAIYCAMLLAGAWQMHPKAMLFLESLLVAA
jgi:tetratricopeptide (TPR) repeat protein